MYEIIPIFIGEVVLDCRVQQIGFITIQSWCEVNPIKLQVVTLKFYSLSTRFSKKEIGTSNHNKGLVFHVSDALFPENLEVHRDQNKI